MSYEKLESIEKKQTNWLGLWWHPEYNGFSSEAIDLAQLRKFKGKVRLYVRKNKFYNNGENGRPNYNFCFKDADAEVFKSFEVVDSDDEDDVPRDREGNRLYTEDEVYQIIHGMESEYGLSYGDNLIGDYLY